MSKQMRFLTLILLSITLCSQGFGAPPEDPVVVVVPARKQIMSLAFDVAALRPTFLISYQNLGKNVAPFMHIWDANERIWRETNPDFYHRGLHFSAAPNTVYLLGAGDEVPSTLSTQPSWAKNQVRLSELDAVSIVNAFSDSLNFSAKEWQWLARRHKLELKDLNEQRRRYGRYGPPKNAAAGESIAPTPVSDIPIAEPVITTVPEPVAIPVISGEEKGVEVQPPVGAPELNTSELEPVWEQAPEPAMSEKGVPPAIDPGSK